MGYATLRAMGVRPLCLLAAASLLLAAPALAAPGRTPIPPASSYRDASAVLRPEAMVLVPPKPEVRRWPRFALRRPPPPPPVAATTACAGDEGAPGGPRVELRVVDGTLEKDQSPWTLLRDMGLRAADIQRMGRDFRPWVRLRRLAPGHQVRAAFRADGSLAWVRHRVGLRDAYCGRREATGHFTVLSDPLPVKTRWAMVEGILYGRWVDAVEAAGEARALGVVAGALFPEATRDVSDLPPEARAKAVPVFRMLVEKRYVEDTFMGYGAVEAIEVEDGTSVRRAFRFAREGKGEAYYDEDGWPLRVRHLRAPVLDGLLTSGYGRRRHPIYRRWRMHRGVDYGAPRGTPVYAVATGTVAHAGWRGKLGRLVILEHEHELTTRYAHLDRIAAGLMKGDRVFAGDLIGYIGSSGFSTGPHLHFETIVDGRHTNPQRYRPPRPPPLSDEERVRFDMKVRRYLSGRAGDLSS